MKTSALLLAVSAMIISCNQKSQTNQNSEVSDTVTTVVPDTVDNTATSLSRFHIDDIPISTVDIGVFPYFSYPKGMKSMNKPIEREYDVIYFPIDGKMTPLEGRVYKANVSLEDRKRDNWSLPFFLKSYDEAILASGGQKIFDGEISREEYDRYSKEAGYLGEDGSIGYANEPIKVYVIRRADGKNVYIQLTGNTASGKLNILQEEGFKQTITKITADDIVQDLNEKGKSILYINFDVDRSNITTDGKEVVDQIAEALKKDSNLKITIEGHTDNTGDASHNKKLSNDRASSVLTSLVAQGIDKSRLSAKGFGAERPLVANDSEDNKAKNRRVELIRAN